MKKDGCKKNIQNYYVENCEYQFCAMIREIILIGLENIVLGKGADKS